MDLKNYQSQTGRTAIYKPELAAHYLFPGLLVEALELQEKVKVFHSGVKAELGDVMWFTSEIHNLGGIHMCQSGPPIALVSPEMCISRIMRHTRNAADKWVKIVRDRGGEYTPAEMQKLVDEVALIPFWCSKIAPLFGTSLESVLAANMAKLTDRQQRGVLGGSGDDR